jgi:glycosyltransferase involved in cell wall biosynthesis
MKIAYVYDAIYPYVKGGVQKRVWEISKRLAKEHEVHLYGMKYWNGEDIIVREGVYLHGVCDPVELYVDGHRSIKEAFYFAAKVFKPLMKEDFNIIDCQHAPYIPCFTAKLGSMLRNIPLFITYHEVWADYWYEYLGFKGFFGKIIEKSTIRLPVFIIAVSEKVREGLLKLGMAEKRIGVVPNGIDFPKIRCVSPSDEEFDVIYVGRLLPHKNVDYLLRALAMIKKRIPDVRCGIIGDGPEMRALKMLCKSLDLSENVKFFGFVEKDEEVYSVMKSSKILILPSIREGFGLVVLEANACGLPVIMVKHELNYASALVAHGKNGFKVGLSEKNICDSTTKLLQNVDYLNKMSEYSIQYAKRHDWESLVDKLNRIYNTFC